MGSQVEVSLAMNQLMYGNRPKKPLISFSLLGGATSNMALILDESTFISLSLTKKPNNFLEVTPKVHLAYTSSQRTSSSLCCGFLYPWISLSYHRHTPLPHYHHIM